MPWGREGADPKSVPGDDSERFAHATNLIVLYKVDRFSSWDVRQNPVRVNTRGALGVISLRFLHGSVPFDDF